jgi:hypothetical protein
MKTTSKNYQSIDVTLSKEEITNCKLDKDKVEKAFANNLIHIVRVPVQSFKEYQDSEIRKLLSPHFQNKCKTVYYIETLDSNDKPSIQSFTPVYY